MSVRQTLIDTIAADGPITVAEYMQHCISYYYATRDPLGKQGDFTTAPEISQVFGEIIGAWMLDAMDKFNSPNILFCELGPGRGTLMQDMLRVIGHNKRSKIDVRLIETSPTLKAAQKQTLTYTPFPVSWYESLENLPPIPLFLVANEFFDALPIHQYMKTDAGWQERKVGYDHDKFFWTPEGEIVQEASPISTNIMATIAAHIKAYGGAALIIDYGFSGATHADTLQAVQHHKYVDVLENPGEADITAHVDFGALLHTAKGRGAYCWGAVEQGIFLKRLGAELRTAQLCKNATPPQQQVLLSGLERLVGPHQMGSLFKVIAVTSIAEKPAGF